MSKTPKSLKDRLAAVENQAEHQDAIRKKTSPSGWEPGVVWDGKKGTITSDTVIGDSDPDWSELLAARGLNPDKYEIVGDTIKWTSYDGWKKDESGETYSTICYSYKADIRLKTGDSPDLEALYQEVRKAKKPKKTLQQVAPLLSLHCRTGRLETVTVAVLNVKHAKLLNLLTRFPHESTICGVPVSISAILSLRV